MESVPARAEQEKDAPRLNNITPGAQGAPRAAQGPQQEGPHWLGSQAP